MTICRNDAEGELVYDRHPVMFGNRPVVFIVLLALTPIIVGALGLLAWYLGTLSNRLTIRDGKVQHRQGLLSKRIKEISISKVRAVEVEQRALQRLTGVGLVRIYTTGDSPEIAIGGMREPLVIKAAVSGSDD